jgi:hypothetical protein
MSCPCQMCNGAGPDYPGEPCGAPHPDGSGHCGLNENHPGGHGAWLPTRTQGGNGS